MRDLATFMLFLRFGAMPVAVTYCPLCGTGMAFRAEAGGKPVQFGVSGLLRLVRLPP